MRFGKVNATPCDVLRPLVAFFPSRSLPPLSPCPWRIASQKQKLLLASQFVFPPLLLWCRPRPTPAAATPVGSHLLFYLYSSAVVILLHEGSPAAATPTFPPPLPSSLDPLQEGEEVGSLSSLFP